MAGINLGVLIELQTEEAGLAESRSAHPVMKGELGLAETLHLADLHEAAGCLEGEEGLKFAQGAGDGFLDEDGETGLETELGGGQV